MRWRHLLRELPRHGWQITECSPHVGLTADESSTDPRRAALAARRAQVMAVAGRIVDPLTRLAQIKPEALAPNNLWSLTGRRLVRETVARANPDVVVATIPPPSALFASAHVVDGIPLVADVRDLWAGNPYYDRGSSVMARLQGNALERAAAVVTVSDGCRNRLLELHPALEGHVHVLPNGFDPQLLGRRRPPSEHEGPRTFVFAGSLYGEHTAAAIVQALALPGCSRTRPAAVGGCGRSAHADRDRLHPSGRRHHRAAGELGRRDRTRPGRRRGRGDHHARHRRRHGAAD